MNNSGTLQLIAQHLALAVEPLSDAVSDLDSFQTFMLQLGWEVDSLPPSYANLAGLVSQISTNVRSLGDSPEPDQVLSLLDKIQALNGAIKKLNETPGGVDPAIFLSEITERIFEFLLVEYLAAELHSVYSTLEMLHVIQRENHEATEERPGFVSTRFLFSEIPKIISDPGSIPERVYGWGTPDFDFELLARHLVELLAALGVPVALEVTNPVLDALFSGEPTTGLKDTGALHNVKITFFETAIGDFPVEIGLVVLKEVVDGTVAPGIVIEPQVPEQITEKFQLDDFLSLNVRAGTDVASRFQIVIRADDVLVHYPFQPGTQLPSAGFGVSLQYKPDTTTILLGDPSSTNLQFQGWTGSLHVDEKAGQVELGIDFSLDGLALVLSAGDQDSFLHRFLGDKNATVQIPITIQWSSKSGLSFSGGAGFQFSYKPDLHLGPLSILEVQFALKTTVDAAHPPDVITEVGVSVAGDLGPISFAIQDVGLRLNTLFQDGNAGPFDISVGFAPPKGVGIAVNAPSVSGGGFLFLDSDKGQYAGVVQLSIQDSISVTAIGLISTRLPNGAKGFSFLVIITAQGFQPIQLGLGFVLTGIGGLLAINRTCNEEFLRDGLKNKTLNDLLFPKDPIRNAPQILGTFNNAFPPQEGSYLFGPVVQICWGTPALLTMDLALILELGQRTRLIILGRVAAILPSEKNDLIRLQMNALGVIDFDQSSISLDAVLYDSRLVGKFPITGSMALRLNWGSAPIFALSIGGFHPAFKPPPSFPVLQRLAISFSNSDNFRLRSESYLAITANTLQFGAKVEMFAKAGSFSIEGGLSYDVLIQFDPFAFLADFSASVQLKYGSHNLFKVKVEGELAGPRPLHIKGKATFEIFWCDFSVGFDKTLAEGEAPPKLAPVDVLSQLQAALNDAQNWSGQLAAGTRRLVTLREPQTPEQIPLHPLGRLAVKQKVVPLELEIARFGNTTPAGARVFTISSLSVGDKSVTFDRVQDFFAPAQFLELSDDEKLAAPSFELMTAGLTVGTDSFLFSANAADILEDEGIQYETIILDKANNQQRPAPPFTIDAQFLSRYVRFGAAARSPLRTTGAARYRVAAAKNALAKKGWTIASTQDGSEQAAPGLEAGAVVSYAESFQALQQLKQENPVKANALMLIRVNTSRN